MSRAMACCGAINASRLACSSECDVRSSIIKTGPRDEPKQFPRRELSKWNICNISRAHANTCDVSAARRAFPRGKVYWVHSWVIALLKWRNSIRSESRLKIENSISRSTFAHLFLEYQVQLLPIYKVVIFFNTGQLNRKWKKKFLFWRQKIVDEVKDIGKKEFNVQRKKSFKFERNEIRE